MFELLEFVDAVLAAGIACILFSVLDELLEGDGVDEVPVIIFLLFRHRIYA